MRDLTHEELELVAGGQTLNVSNFNNTQTSNTSIFDFGVQRNAATISGQSGGTNFGNNVGFVGQFDNS